MKKLEEMSDEELLMIWGVPEEKLEENFRANIQGAVNWGINSGEACDIIMSELERRHGEKEALCIVGERFGF